MQFLGDMLVSWRVCFLIDNGQAWSQGFQVDGKMKVATAELFQMFFFLMVDVKNPFLWKGQFFGP